MKGKKRSSRLWEPAATAASILLLVGMSFFAASLIGSGVTLNSSHQTDNTDNPALSVPSESTEPSVPSQSTEIPPEDTPNVVNGVYATCENYDYTIYMGLTTQPYIEFSLICKDALPEDAQLVLNNANIEYKVSVIDCTPETIQTAYRQYHMYMDDSAMACNLDKTLMYQKELLQLVLQVSGEYENPANGTKYAQYREFLETKKEYEAFAESYAQQYSAYQFPEIPVEYYLYRIKVIFTKVYEEGQIKSIELIAGDMSRSIPLKNVRVFPKQKLTGISDAVITDSFIAFPFIENTSDYFTLSDLAQTNPWGTGTASFTHYFTANKNINLKDMYVYGSNDRVKLHGAELLIVNEENDVTTAKWTPGTDLVIRKGETVAMEIYFSDSHTEQANYAMKFQVIIAYEYDGKSAIMLKDLHICRNADDYSYPLYQWAFEGRDVKRYYTEYHNPEYKLTVDAINAGYESITDAINAGYKNS